MSEILEQIIRTYSGTVGRVEDEKTGSRRIGIQFEYYEDDPKQLFRSPVYTLGRHSAVHAGWQLLTRGITDIIKNIFKIN